MRVTFPVESFRAGETHRVLAAFTNQLTRRGHEVTILMPSKGLVDYGIESKLIRVEHDALEESDYPPADAIVSNHDLTFPSAHTASEKGKGAHISFGLCLDSSEYPVTDKWIVLSEWQRQFIKVMHGIDGIVVPRGVDSIFDNYHNREHLQQMTIAAVVRASENTAVRSGQEYMIGQLEQIKKTYLNVDIHLIFLSNELAASPALQSLHSSLQLFKMFVPTNDIELCYCYNQAHIFVTVSSFTAADSIGMEAMKCGAAVVVVDTGGNTDYCKQEDMLRLIKHPRLLMQLAKQSEKDARQWTWERSAELFEQAVHTLTAARLPTKGTIKKISSLLSDWFKFK